MKYLDRVRVKSGFYEGVEGILVDEYLAFEDGIKMYEIEIGDNKTISIKEDDLELINK